MKALVTGGAGFIGSNLVDRLIKLNYEVIVIDNKQTRPWNINAENHILDVCDYQATKDLYKGVDYVFHLAAVSNIPDSIQDPVNAFNVNTTGTAIVLQCSREANVKKVIYSSTASAYGNNPVPNIELQVDDPLNPYAVSKVNGEKICSMYKNLFGLNTIILRYFNVYGDTKSEVGKNSPIISIFMKQKQNNKTLTVAGSGEQRRDFVHVSDVVRANILAAESNVLTDLYGQVYNVGSGVSHSVIEIANMISNDVSFIPAKVAEIKESLSNIDKIRAAFGWEPKVKLEEWIAENK
jgi:UDP-glucose 4-epimerase